MKQQADKEMKAIRRVLDILGELEPSARARVLAFVHDRTIVNPPIEEPSGRLATQPPAGDLKKDLTSPQAIVRQQAQPSFDLFGTGATKVPTLDGGGNG